MKAAPTTYGEGPARCGLVISMGPLPPPVVLDAADIEWPENYAPHYGVHQMDLTQDPTSKEKAA